MRKHYLLYGLAVVALCAVGLQSCKKDNNINNASVIATPYSLYFSDSAGTLLNTNDGILFKSIFPADGVPSRAILIAGSNLLWVKNNAHVSTNDGQNMNPTYTHVNPLAFNQTLLCKADNRVYIASSAGNTGIEYSNDNGAQNSWYEDPAVPTGVTGFRVTSYTQLANGDIIAFDWTNTRTFKKSNYPPDAMWKETSSPLSVNQLPSGHVFSIAHFNNTLVAVDLLGGGGYYSDNEGNVWQKYIGLPNRPAYIAYAPFDAVLLVGTDSMGVYMYKGGAFVSSNNGLAKNTSVRAITAKEDIYVNGIAQQYIYLATSTGIYRSQDMGQNWILIKDGNYYSVN